ncbi:hypothetical protein C1H46_027416 [Malus baccata]|uniref:Uncharacterized protein n=1 Tax=Malus baccata TaxID=106549 RepID=A0A540LKM4_MALBA|nr:hypothetical protein C1H46_027416 [Malus baccata]
MDFNPTATSGTSVDLYGLSGTKSLPEPDVNIFTCIALCILVHSYILASVPPVLENVIDWPHKHQSSERVILILGVPYDAVFTFVRFLYSSRFAAIFLLRFAKSTRFFNSRRRHPISVVHFLLHIEMTEHFDMPQVLQEKIEQLVMVIQKSKHLVVFTCARILTSCGIPDFRGPMGIWTLQEKKLGKKPIFSKILWIQRSQFIGKFQKMENRTRYLYQIESAIFSPRQFLFHIHGSTAGPAHLRIHVTDFH